MQAPLSGGDKTRVHRNSGLHPGGRQTVSCYIVLSKLRLHDMQVSHGTLIVTGASRGIGAAIATLAAERGFSVAVNFATGQAEAKAVVEQILSSGGRARAIQADVGREEDVLRLFAAAERELGPIKALVNNAAITGGFARVDSVSAEALTRVMAVNVTGAILCAREAVRRMSTRHGGSGGAIVNISSRAAHTGAAGEWVHYAASKGAIDSFTIGLAREVATEGIRVNAVAPGLIETGLHAANGAPDRLQRLAATMPMQRPGTPLEVAEAVLWLLSPAASYTAGAILEVGGGR
jgi:NAD(P)-dependent dehydrogenase (short-subunit alcohol dehydrogenase family)